MWFLAFLLVTSYPLLVTADSVGTPYQSDFFSDRQNFFETLSTRTRTSSSFFDIIKRITEFYTIHIKLGVSVHFLSFLQNSPLRNAILLVLGLLVGFALCISNTGQFSTMARIPPAQPGLQALPPWQSFPNRGCTAQSSLPVDGHR